MKSKIIFVDYIILAKALGNSTTNVGVVSKKSETKYLGILFYNL